MHLARLYDPSRVPHDYSLASLSDIYGSKIASTKKKIFEFLRKKYKDNIKRLHCIKKYELTSTKQKKIDIKHTFGFYKTLKDGAQGKTLVFPDIEEMHTSAKYVEKWVEYSVFDAEITYFLREALTYELCNVKIESENMRSMYDLYCKYWLPFGDLLTDMEREGIMIDVDRLKQKQIEAENDRNKHEEAFINWVQSIQPNAKGFNPSSTQQMQQLLFAPFNKIANPKMYMVC
jgi:DNA polymerase-1